MIANSVTQRQPSQMDHLLNRKIEMGGSLAIQSDQNTVISGYDSVGEDFAGTTTTDEISGNSSPTLIEDPKANDGPHDEVRSKTTQISDHMSYHTTFTDSTLTQKMQSQPLSTYEMQLANEKSVQEQGIDAFKKLKQSVNLFEENLAFNPGIIENRSNNYQNIPATNLTSDKKPETLMSVVYEPNEIQSVTSYGAPCDLKSENPFEQKFTSHQQTTEKSASSVERLAETAFQEKSPSNVDNSPQSNIPVQTKPPKMVPAVPQIRHQKNDSVVDKWPLKTNNKEAITKSIIEVPERQSVASLRQKIASKLEVKSPCSTMPSNAIASGSSQQKQVPYQNYLQTDTRILSPSKPTIPASTTNCSYQVHEPVQRHISCVTPVSFSMPKLSHSSSQQFTAPYQLQENSTDLLRRNNSVPQLVFNVSSLDNNNTGSFDNSIYKNNSRSELSYKPSGNMEALNVKIHESDSAIDLIPPAKPPPILNGNIPDHYYSGHVLVSPSTISMDSTQPEMPVFSTPFELRSSNNTFLPSSTTYSSITSSIHSDLSKHNSSVSNSDIKSRNMTKPFSDETSNSQWYRRMYNKMHRIDNAEQSVFKHHMRELRSPFADYKARRAWTPTSRLESKSVQNDQRPIRSKSVGRYAESSECVEETINQWKDEHSKLSSMQKLRTISPTYGSYRNMIIASPNTSKNLFALEKSKTDHFHIPPYRLENKCYRSASCHFPVFSSSSCHHSASSTNCMFCYCPRHEISWSEIEFLYKTLGKHEIHNEIFKEQISKNIKNAAIHRKLEEATNELQIFIDQLTNLQKLSFIEKDLTAMDAREIKKSTKQDIINRKKIEKLSEELNEQRSRRHGYVPSATPSLQKSFDRLGCLMSDFGSDSYSNRSLPFIFATALYSFQALGAKELSFNRGDVLRVRRIIDSNWMEGEKSGKIGIFPSSYVQVDSLNEKVWLIAQFPFYARNSNELSLKKDEIILYKRRIDENWLEGINERGQIGIFPKAYVRDIDNSLAIVQNKNGPNDEPNRPKTPKFLFSPSSEQNVQVSRKKDHESEVIAWTRRHKDEGLSGYAQIVPTNSETYRVLYDYQPMNADELELRENDIVFVVEKCDDGWYIGTLLRTGQFGTFPGNYVQRH